MFDNESFPIEALSDPRTLQKRILEELQDRSNGKVVVADPNNSFMFALEGSSSMTAQFSRTVENLIDEIYPARASSQRALYRFMSDYDYTDLMAEPAVTQISVFYDRDELITKAVEFNAAYSKVVIPAGTVFRIGALNYGIYYPIEIRISAKSKSFSVVYDTTTENPLHVPSTNQVDFTTFVHDGIRVLGVTFPIYQFVRDVYEETVVKEAGFNVTYNYSDNFMAARVFTFLNGAWKEITYTLSENVYDRNVATARLKVDPNLSQVSITIPQIYIDRGLIGSKNKVEIYGSKGEIDVSITKAEAAALELDYGVRGDNVSVYSAGLSPLVYHFAHPLSSRVVGGKTSISFEELRNRVIYGSLVGSVPITPLDLENYISDAGFVLTRHSDTITQRTYFANRKLIMGESTPAPVTVGEIVLPAADVESIESIISFDDDTAVILPTTIYRYSDSVGQCTPLLDDEVAALDGLDKAALAAYLNENVHTRMPFHLAVYTSDKYPSAKTFNLMSPSAGKIQLVQQNGGVAAQMSLRIASITHLQNGTGGYKIQLGITKTADLAEVDESDIFVIITTVDKSGRIVYLKCEKTGETDQVHVYAVEMITTYHLDKDGYLRFQMSASAALDIESDLLLSSEFNVILMVSPDVVPDSVSYSVPGVPVEYLGNVELVRQSVHITFGEDLSANIFNQTNAVWSSPTYSTYDEVVYLTYSRDIYEIDDETGAPVYEIVEGAPVFNILHEQGDQILDEEDNPIVKHEIGDIKLDSEGLPIVLQDRSIKYYIESMMFDARLYASEGLDEINYLSGVPEEITAYASTIAIRRRQMTENTRLYFQPIKTIGNATFELGNGRTAIMDLGLGFTIKYYVTKAVNKNQNLKDVIAATTVSVIEANLEERVVSITKISKDLRDALGDSIISVDSVGINGTTTQTLKPIGLGVSPTVATLLSYGSDGSLTLEKDIEIEFAYLEED